MGACIVKISVPIRVELIDQNIRDGDASRIGEGDWGELQILNRCLIAAQFPQLKANSVSHERRGEMGISEIKIARFARRGDDLVYGGNGQDNLSGGSGNDSLYGEADNDTLRGGSGNDYLDGGSETDSLTGNSGTDTCVFGETLATCEL